MAGNGEEPLVGGGGGDGLIEELIATEPAGPEAPALGLMQAVREGQMRKWVAAQDPMVFIYTLAGTVLALVVSVAAATAVSSTLLFFLPRQRCLRAASPHLRAASLHPRAARYPPLTRHPHLMQHPCQNRTSSP